MAIDDEVSVHNLHVSVVLAVRGVILEQVRLKRGAGAQQPQARQTTHHVRRVQEGIVDGDDLDGLLAEGSAKHESSDATKSIAQMSLRSIQHGQTAQTR